MALKETYVDDHEAFLDATACLAADFQRALEDGIAVEEGGSQYRIRLCVTGVKGDLPFLQSAGALERTFRRAPKKGAPAAAKSVGICHYCMAGFDNYSFADVSESPPWEQSMASGAARVPWETVSPFTSLLPSYDDFPPRLYRFDIWHNWHLGLGRYFLASSLICMLGLFHGTSVDTRFHAMTSSWRSFCRRVRQRPILTRFSREVFSYFGNLDWPEGGWQKASTTTLLMVAWLQPFP